MSRKERRRRLHKNPVQASAPAQEISAAQLAANRANAQLSGGPVTPEGRAKSSLNAVKTGLSGQTILLPNEDVAAYEAHMRAYEARLAPVGQIESDLVCSIAQTAWRLARIPSLEAAVFAMGLLDLADQFEEHDPKLRAAMIQLAVYTRHERQLRNLHLQEARLARRREKEMVELAKLQEEREAQAAAEQQSAAPHQSAQPPQSAPLTRNGFEFSNDESTLLEDLDFGLGAGLDDDIAA